MKNTKAKLARRLISKKEKKDKVSIFDSSAWNARKEGIKEKISNNNKKIQAKKKEREATGKLKKSLTKKRLKITYKNKKKQEQAKAKKIKYLAKKKQKEVKNEAIGKNS